MQILVILYSKDFFFEKEQCMGYQKLILYSIAIVFMACQVDSKQEQKTRIDSAISPKKIVVDTIPPLPIGIQKLLKAYPAQLKGATADTLTWMDGTKMAYDDGIQNKTFRELLNQPDLQDQVENMVYTKGKQPNPPSKNDDPGRIRYEPFFLKMYGDSKESVKKNLVEVDWLPNSIGTKIWVTTINEVHQKIVALSTALEKHPDLHKYLTKPGGTFNWRKIAGTDRMSMHSFGMTIDINVGYSDYWRWNIQDGDVEGTKTIAYRNKIPLKLVELFEQHGFIWGGKWYHYDTMHFEYRPELLNN